MGNCFYKSDDMDASVYDTHRHEQPKSKEEPMLKYLTSKPH